MAKKYCLVRFIDDNILYVCPTKKTKRIDKKLLMVPYKSMGCYKAISIHYDNNRKLLEKKMRCIKEREKDNDEVGNCQFNNTADSIRDPSYDPEKDSGNQDKDEHQFEYSNDDALNRLDLQTSLEPQVYRDVNIASVDLETKPGNIDYRELNVSYSHSKSKKHFCMFCHKLQTKFARHLENVHRTEESVKQFISLEPKSRLRAQLITIIRTKGDLMFNTSNELNASNSLIVVRRPAVKKERSASHFKPCGSCGGMYSSLSLSSHYKRCEVNRMKGSKDARINSNKKSIFVSTACNVLRNDVLPVLREDDISQTILSDDLIIAYGNRLCQKYRSPHLHKMIRARLRCVARLYVTIKKSKPDMRRFEQLFDPEYYDCIIQGINEMCDLNVNTGKYKSPATAFAVGSYLKKISFYLLSECIKKKQKEKQENVKDFIQLLNEGLPHDVYKTVEENQLEQKRKKIVHLPGSDDITALRMFLNKSRDILMHKLNSEYSFSSWKELLSILLISLQLFNRRRAGEIERVKIEDFLRYEQLKDDDEMFRNSVVHEKNKKKSYVRFLIRGKLSRGVPVMVDRENFNGLKLILKFRGQTNISTKNPYLFGLPGKGDYNHLLATLLMNKYSKLCGARNPHTLRGTELRKHIATKCGTMNLGNEQIKDVADYLGHDQKIHMDHYRMPNATKDIVRMSNILEKAQGNDDENVHESFLESESQQIDFFSHSESGVGDTTLRELNSQNEINYSTESQHSHKRLSWSDDEKQCAENCLQYYLDNFELPSLNLCDEIISRNETLRRRSATQLKAFVANRIEKRKKTLNQKFSEKITRRYWDGAERKAALSIFSNEIKNKKLPSLRYCQEVLKQNLVFVDRTPKMLKAFINNTLKKQQT